MIRVFLKSSVVRNANVTRAKLAAFNNAGASLRLYSRSSWSASDHVRIGHVEMPLQSPAPEVEHLVPSNYLPPPEMRSPEFLRHLQWLMAKDILGQDMLLIGPPGSGAAYRRRLALAYAQMVQKPVEILTLGSDLTESDLKQRRELVVGSSSPDQIGSSTAVEFQDQAPVRAAKHGHLLILDGLERAERNVLPTLNNLLENREMHLENGSFMISPRRYEQLQQQGGTDASSSFLVPVHPDFRVIALGVPTPPYKGRTLDPPIRSRFQIRRIDNPSSDILYENLVASTGGAEEDKIKFCATLAGAMKDQKPDFPSTSLDSIVRTMQTFPDQSTSDVLLRAYPLAVDDHRFKSIYAGSFQNDDTRQGFWTAVETLQESSELGAGNMEYSIGLAHSIDAADSPLAEVEFHGSIDGSDSTSDSIRVTVPCGTNELNKSTWGFVPTVGSSKALSAMMQDHSAGRDILLLSPKGEGKSATALEFASILGYDTNLFAMYKEISAQDLLQRRTTDAATGKTQWEDSPLITAAKNGEICILDGIEKMRPDVLASLQSLTLDREITLPDGRRVMPHDSAQESFSDEDVVRVHPSFRIIGLASLKKDAGAKWLTSDLMSMFGTSLLPAPTEECLRAILKSANSLCPDTVIDALLHLQGNLTETVAEDCGVAQLSTRNLIRVARRVGTSASKLHSTLSSVLLVDLLPPSQRALIESILDDSGIAHDMPTPTEGDGALSITIDEEKVQIGSLQVKRAEASRPEMVPSPKSFFDIPCHVRSIQELLGDWRNGERALLLLGNQGVGKNMIVDRICEIANWEREYIQLHRDSTIGQLTLTPTLEDGRIIWKDSPLVRAVRDGCVLVVDEADKAPVEVVSVLKGLIEDGELLLADGRRISTHQDGPGFIKVHPDFSLWVLANRPGFPFLGNNFFREIGDCFSTRVIQNPDLVSEIRLLESYAPSLDISTLRSVASAFSELRHLSDRSEINYPYSTREAVAVVKHLERFPQDSIVTALHNVLDFDSFDETTYATLGKVFQRHGIEVTDYPTWHAAMQRSATAAGEALEVEYFGKRPDGKESAKPPDTNMPKRGKWDEQNAPHSGGNTWAGGTGGSDTAGLGGRGGPYRLDRGHIVNQVSEEAKAQVSEEASKAAREMAEKMLAERLEEIGMSNREWEMYAEFGEPIKEDIARLRSILDTVISKSDERGWLKSQSHGEIDDTKLIDGATGDRFIFKRRGVKEDEPNHKTKRLRFVMDCSGSMYRFNGYDERLMRCLQAALLVMESFEGFESRYEYSIVGHSGDSPCIPLVDFGEPPKNENERIKILQQMVAHSQFCASGDFTLEAMERAIVDVANRAANEAEETDCIVIGISDANLARYGIPPRLLGRALEAGEDSKVKAFCVFIASIGEEADEIKRALPVGKGHVCMQTSDLPKVVRDILSSNLS